MWSWLKTPSGAFALSMGLQVAGWLLAGFGIWVGLHLTRVREQDAKWKRQQLENDLSASRAKISELENHQKPRAVTPIQRELLIRLLGDSPKGRVSVQENWLDMEAAGFAKEVEDVLRESGFTVEVWSGQVVALRGKGIFLCIPDLANPPTHAVPLQNAFREAGILLDGAVDAQVNADQNRVVIWVSTKP